MQSRPFFLDAEIGSIWILIKEDFSTKNIPVNQVLDTPVTFIVVLVVPPLFKVFREAVLFWVNWKVADPEERWGAVGKD